MVRPVRNAAHLRACFFDDTVDVAELHTDVLVNEAEWPPSPVAHVRAGRTLVIRSRLGLDQPRWAMLDLAFTSGRVRLGVGANVTFTRIFLQRVRSLPQLSYPGECTA